MSDINQKAGLSDIVAPAPLVFDDKNRISARCKVLSVEFEITDCIFSWPVSRDRFPQSFWQDQTYREGKGGEGGLNLSKTSFCYFTRDQSPALCSAARILNSFPHLFPRS